MIKKNKRLMQGFRYETLGEKIRYMLSLPLSERYAQNLIFSELMGLGGKNKGYQDDRKAFSTVQVIKKK